MFLKFSDDYINISLDNKQQWIGKDGRMDWLSNLHENSRQSFGSVELPLYPIWNQSYAQFQGDIVY